MSHYLDPKVDVVFKRVFGDHPKLLKSFLNAVLPLPKDGLIESLEYLLPEQVPTIPLLKSTVVDVKCTDQQGRIFIVEMQVQWVANFMQRMLFNTSHAYVKQLTRGDQYHLLKPVYGLGLIDSQFDLSKTHWYHHYKLIDAEKPDAEIKDLQLIFIELPKFQKQAIRDERLQTLWLRFISELGEKTEELPESFLEVPEIKEAVELTKQAGYSMAQLAAYEQYWDRVSIERTVEFEFYQRGEQAGIQQGVQQGDRMAREHLARKLLAKSMPIKEVAELTGLSIDQIRCIENDSLLCHS